MQDRAGDTDANAIDVVIVHFETPDLLRRCVDSLLDNGGEAVRSVVVVDNSVSDHGRAGAAAVGSSRVEIITPDENVGYGSAANLGAGVGAARRLLVLNADTVLLPGALDELAAALQRHDMAVAGPRL